MSCEEKTVSGVIAFKISSKDRLLLIDEAYLFVYECILEKLKRIL